MILDRKDIDMLELYLSRESVPVKGLEEDTGVTERAIRTRLENLNYVFQKSRIKTRLKIEKNNVALKNGNSNLREFIENFELANYNFNKLERMEIIKFLSFVMADGFKFEMTEQILNIGKSTLKNDMREIRKEFFKNRLDFISRPGKGLILTGNENIIREMLMEYLLKYFYIKNFTFPEIRNRLDPVARIMEIWGKKLKIEDMNIYFQFLKKIEEKMGKIISDEGFEALIFYLLIIHSRKNEASLSDEHISNKNFLKATNEYQLLSRMTKEWHYKGNRFKDNESEILKFTEYLLGTHSYNFDYSFYENWIQIETLVREIIKNVDKNLDFSIINDEILEDGLVNHIRPTIYRIKNGIKLKKLDIREITEKYDKLFNIVKESVKPLEDYLGKKIEIEELAYFTIYFKLAMDRNKKNTSQYIRNILIVCNFGYGTSQLLVESLKEKYILNIIDVIPYNSFLNYDLKNVDLIISTIDISGENMKKPIVKVKPVPDEDDNTRIKKYLKEKIYENVSLSKVMEIIERHCRVQNRGELQKELKSYLKTNGEEEKEHIKTLLEILPAENIKILDSVSTWQEGIGKSGGILLDNGYINWEYIKECTDIIFQKGMYMLIGRNIILPHGSIKKNTLKTGMSFLKLNNEVLFPGDVGVKHVVMLATLDKKEHINAFLQLKKIIDETNFLDEIDNISDEAKLYRIIKEKFEQVKNNDFEILKYK